MTTHHRILISTTLVGLALLLPVRALAGPGAESPTTTYKMSNGMEVILKENHASPMVASIVFVRSGAKYETDFNNGATHFLEHLLFNGTASRTQEEISDRIKNLGGYINAFTRKELTAYMSLVPSEYIGEALDIQQDMLFNSIFPEDRFPKERGIVIEEIRKDADNPEYIAELFYDQWAYRGSPYSRPVLGYENLISTIPREEIIDYYHTYYQPNNMILLVIGDFESATMKEQLETTFGRHPARPIPPRPEIIVPPIQGQTVKRTEARIAETHIDFHIRLPRYTDPAYPALTLLAEILNERALSPLHKRLLEGEKPLATNATASLETQDEFSALHIGIQTADTANVEPIIGEVTAILKDLPKLTVIQEDIGAIATRLRVEDIFLRERLHYYAIMKAPLLVTTGYEFMDGLPDNLAKVTLSALRSATTTHLAAANYIATVVTPVVETERKPGAASAESRNQYEQRTLANGLTVIVKSNPDSRVFAINILGKNRTAIEPEGMTGISDFVNRMLVSGTATRTADQISRELTAIGGELTTNDNPYIPYDDHYTCPQYTFVKFGTIDEFAPRGVALLADLIGNSNFPESEVAKTQSQVMGILGMSSGSTSQTCRDLFYELLFDGKAYSRPVMGVASTVGRFTSSDLKAHLQTLYAPRNMILTCVTNLDPANAFALIEEHFGKLPEGTPPAVRVENPVPPSGEVSRHQPMEKEQVYIYLGGPIPGASDSAAAAVQVATRILSSRLGNELRERQGLAYSVGASVRFDRDFGWYAATMGTGHDNYPKARDGMLAEIRRLGETAPSAEEVEIAQNTIWGSGLTAGLSRITQAYEMGVDEFLGLGYDYSERMAVAVRAVTPEQVRLAAKRWFDPQNYILATVGKLE